MEKVLVLVHIRNITVRYIKLDTFLPPSSLSMKILWRSPLISLPSSLLTLLSSLNPLSPPFSLRVTAHWKTNILTLHAPPPLPQTHL